MKIKFDMKNYTLKGYIIVILSLFASSMASAQQTRVIIETTSNALVLEANTKGELNTHYFGKKLSNKEEYAAIPAQYRQGTDYTGMLASAYTSSGSRNLLEPAITVTHSDGNNSLDLRYVSHEVQQIDANVQQLSIVLKDPVYPFTVTLFYRSYFAEDVIEQWTSIQHNEKGNVTLYKYASANLYLKGDSFWLTQYHGDWAKEMQPEETKMTHGIKTLDSKLGTRTNLFQPSVFMLSLNTPATEHTGSVLLEDWNTAAISGQTWNSTIKITAGSSRVSTTMHHPIP